MCQNMSGPIRKLEEVVRGKIFLLSCLEKKPAGVAALKASKVPLEIKRDPNTFTTWRPKCLLTEVMGCEWFGP